MSDTEQIAKELNFAGRDLGGDLKKLEEFLSNYDAKENFEDYLESNYKKLENERIEQLKAYEKEEYDNAHIGSTPYYTPGHIGPLVDEYMNMISVESAIANSMQHTKGSLVKNVIQRVDEVNTLLRGVGGFNRQIKPSFTRSAVNYMEKEDPIKRTRERISFTINLSDLELRFPLVGAEAEKVTDDGRTVKRYAWDYAVNTLAEIVAGTGLKPKFVLNKKNDLEFILKQDSFPQNERGRIPDEYFEFTMIYYNEANRQKQLNLYNIEKSRLEQLLEEAKAKGNKEEITAAYDELDFYLGVTPDPSNMDQGVNLMISAYTLKDYTITKDKMQVIMTKFILALSKLAKDKSLDEQLMTSMRGVGNTGTEGDKLAQVLGKTLNKEINMTGDVPEL